MSRRGALLMSVVLGSAAAFAVGRASSAETQTVTPVRVHKLTDVVAVAAGGNHTLALTGTGAVYAWGSNKYGQLGVPTATKQRDEPAKVTGLPGKAVAIAAAQGGDYSMALMSDGSVWAWGYDTKKQLGSGAKPSPTCQCDASPVQVTGLTSVKAIAASGGTGVALMRDGSVRAWGDNTFGQLGNGNTGGFRAAPARINGVTGVKMIAGGGGFILALLSDRTVLSWGIGDFGERGDGTDRKASGVPAHVAAPTSTPVIKSSSTNLGMLTQVIGLGAGGGHGLALRTDGTAVSWGYNASGQLGVGVASDVVVRPTPVHHLATVRALAGAEQLSLALRRDGTVWAWGENEAGGLGSGQIGQGKNLPAQVQGLPQRAKAVDAGGSQLSGGATSYALLTDGSLYAWGNDKYGQLGDGSATASANTSTNGGGSHVGPLSLTTFLLILLAAAIPVTALMAGARRRRPAAAHAGPRGAYPPYGSPQIPYPDPVGGLHDYRRAAGVVPAGTAEAGEAEHAWREYGRRVAFLSRVNLFASASQDLLAQVAAVLKLRTVPAGGIVCRQGDPGEDFFLIEQGTLAVVAEVNGRIRELALLGPGEFFGEAALLGGARRSATVRAKTDAQLWALPAREFEEFLRRAPELAKEVRRAAAQRSAPGRTGLFDVERRDLASLADAGNQIRIGRSPDNDIVFGSRLVSGHHAIIESSGTAFRLHDLNSTNGTFVNGARTRTAELKDGDEVWIADERFVFDSRAIHRSVEPHGIRVDAAGVGKQLRDGKVLLHDVTLSILPGEFVAIVGGSGAGKTTLMDALSGVRPPTAGSVLYNGRDYYRDIDLFRNVLGYVPQDDIIHTGLPLRVTLRHAARLRLPVDTSPPDVEDAVERALRELELTSQADVKVAQLSGGQRKRASIGGELLTEPRIFFLDEPTSGLDPFTDAQMMQLLRGLADGGSTVVLTTHATKNVMLCDKIVVLSRGGRLAFAGRPQRALWYFDTDSFDDIYRRLAEEGTPEEWADRFLASEDYRQVMADQLWAADTAGTAADRASLGDAQPPGIRRQLRQLAVLTRRSIDLLRHNPKNIPSLVMPPILFSILALALFHSGAFDLGASSAAPLQILFLIAFSAFIFGLLFAIQEIVSEFPILRRERLVSLGIVPYVLSKLAVLAPILTLLLLVMVGILRLTSRLPSEGFAFYGRLLLTLLLTGFVGLALALLTSAAVSTSQQATDMLSVWIMPQVLFGGALLAVPAMNAVGRVIAAVAPVRWAFEGLGNVTDLPRHFERDTTPLGPGLSIEYGDSFKHDPLQNWIILLIFILVPLALTCLVLKRKTTSR